MSQPDSLASLLARVLVALGSDEREAARVLLNEVAFAPTEPVRRSDPSINAIVAVFARDRWQCRYCGIRTVPAVVLRLISRAFPAEFPYHPNWRPGQTHPVYAARATTLDHVVPVAAGGAQKDLANLVTACWPCNSQKGDMSLDRLGWRVREPDDDEWDGLLGSYEAAYVALGSPPITTDERTFLRAAGVVLPATQ